MKRAKPDTVCALMIGGTILEAVQGQEYPDDHPLVIARPQFFEDVPAPKAAKDKA